MEDTLLQTLIWAVTFLLSLLLLIQHLKSSKDHDLMKAKIWANSNYATAQLENQASNYGQTGGDDWSSIIKLALQNPDLIKGLLTGKKE